MTDGMPWTETESPRILIKTFASCFDFIFCGGVFGCLTKKAEPPPTRGVNRDSGTASANGGWLRRLVRRL